MQGIAFAWCEINRRWALLSHSESLNTPDRESSRPQYSTDSPLRAVAPEKSPCATTLPELAIEPANPTRDFGASHRMNSKFRWVVPYCFSEIFSSLDLSSGGGVKSI